MADERVIDSGAVASGDSAQPTDAGQVTPSSATADSGQQAAKPVEAQVNTWDKDARYERMWKKDPNGLYKSYTELEKVYNPLKENYGKLEGSHNEIVNIFKEMGIEPTAEQIKGVMSELSTLKDPSNPRNQRADYIGKWIDHKNPQYSQKFIAFCEDMDRQELQDRFPNMNAEQIQKQMELEAKLEKLESAENYRTSTQTLQQSLGKIQGLSEKWGFPFDDKVRTEFLKHCKENGVAIKDTYHEFIDMYGDKLEASFSNKIKSDQLKELEKNKHAVVVAGTPQAGSAPKTGFDFKRDAMSALGGANKT